VSRAQTSFGPGGNPAPSTRRQRWPVTTAVSAAHRSHIGASQPIASPSPSAVSTSPTIFHRRRSTASKIDHHLPTGLRKVRASRALNQHRGRPEIMPQDNIQITTLWSGQAATANHEVVMTLGAAEPMPANLGGGRGFLDRRRGHRHERLGCWRPHHERDTPHRPQPARSEQRQSVRPIGVLCRKSLVIGIWPRTATAATGHLIGVLTNRAWMTPAPQ
jgi:hypothetical protein